MKKSTRNLLLAAGGVAAYLYYKNKQAAAAPVPIIAPPAAAGYGDLLQDNYGAVTRYSMGAALDDSYGAVTRWHGMNGTLDDSYGAITSWSANANPGPGMVVDPVCPRAGPLVCNPKLAGTVNPRMMRKGRVAMLGSLG